MRKIDWSKFQAQVKPGMYIRILDAALPDGEDCHGVLLENYPHTEEESYGCNSYYEEDLLCPSLRYQLLRARWVSDYFVDWLSFKINGKWKTFDEVMV